jgi:hypothetical protein
LIFAGVVAARGERSGHHQADREGAHALADIQRLCHGNSMISRTLPSEI